VTFKRGPFWARPRRGRQSAGQALVEFAIVVPLFVLLLAGIIDFGLGLYSYMTVITSAREGGRLAVTACSAGPCTTVVKARVASVSGNMVTTSNVTMSCYTAADTTFASPYNCDTAPVPFGDAVRVAVSYTYKMIWPLAFGTQIPLTSTITMLVE
jgi:Flp pilus assembly protein TadG